MAFVNSCQSDHFSAVDALDAIGDGCADSLHEDTVQSVCTPEWRGCIMGLQAVCSKDGIYVDYTSCPAGQVCVGDECVANTATVYFVTGEPPSDGIMRPDVIPMGCGCKSGPDLPPCVAMNEVEELNPRGLQDVQESSGEMLFGDVILLQRMAIRRMLVILGDSDGLRFSLFHKPSVTGTPTEYKYGESFERWISGYRITPETYYPDDWEEAQWFGQVPGFRQWYFNNVGSVYFARPEPAGGIPCMPELVWGDGNWSSNLADFVMAVPPWGTAETVGSWVDEIALTRDIGTACSQGPDCGTSVCLSQTCVEIENPEVPGRLLDSEGLTGGRPERSPMLFYASSVAARLGRMQGVKCHEDSDCLDPVYKCSEGFCDDPARFCRRHHIVLFAQRDCSPDNKAQKEEVAPLEGNWLPYWLKYGVWKPCESESDCPGPQKCLQYWPYWGADEAPANPPSVCVPDFWVASGTAAGVGTIYQCEGSRPVRFENSYPLDREGHRISFTTHQVDMIWQDGFAALYGGGLSTTMGYKCELGNWDAGLTAISTGILSDLQDFQCSPSEIPRKLLPGLRDVNDSSFEWEAVPGAVCGEQHKDYP